jgi:Rps23 Pro-64 3,4-dihydroxylase Tpa1-like proline 4-hydroxylase
MAEIDVTGFVAGPPAFPDFTLYGAGLHEIPSQGWLSRHLDSTHHPITQWTRVASMVLFINSIWESDWGGELVVGGTPVEPKQGRTVIMSTHDSAYHEVRKVTGPDSRKTLAMFWWSTVQGNQTRPSAQFMDAT